MAKKELKTEVKAAPSTKSLTTTEHVGNNGLTEFQENGAWGSEEISNEDIVIPKILLMQPMSELVTDGIARIGEYRDSLNTERMLGNDKVPVELIIFGTFKTWIEFKDGEYLATKRWEPSNADLAKEEIMEDGSVLSRDKVLNFYCLIPKDVAGGEPFPFVLACRRTSALAGRELNTHIKKLSMFKKPAAAKVFALTSYKETNDKGTFFVSTVKVLRDSTNEEQAAAYEWYKALAKSKVRIDESDLSKDTTSTVNTAQSDNREARPVQ